MSFMTDAAYIQELKSALGPKGFTQDADIIAPSLREWRDKYIGNTPIMLLPNSPQQVSDCIKICAARGISIMPQGGNTGLVGGNTPMGEVLLSTRRLNKIRSISASDNAMVVESGVTLKTVQDIAQENNRKFPLSLASEGSCTIGGNLSTNAGGVHVIKYGTTKDLVSGVEAVLPDGRIFNGLTSLKKDNTGYDLSRMFLGAEGTLGIITAASLKLFPKPKRLIRVMAGVSTVTSAMALLDLCQRPALTMFEIMPRIGLKAVVDNIPGHTDPLANAHNWYALIDFEYFQEPDGIEDIEAILGRALDQGLIDDAVIAQSETQKTALLGLRENMSAAQKFVGASIKHDISIPVSRVNDFLDRADKAVMTLAPGCRPIAFGHLGDGNIHYNVASAEGVDREAFLLRWETIQAAVHDVVDSLGGSISAEHGIGTMKKEDLAMRGDPVKLEMLRSLRETFDPKRTLNPRVLV